MDWRVGIHLCDILIESEDIIGDGVNLAARLEGIAEPGGICISEDAFRQVRGKIDIEFRDGGEQALKNLAQPVRVYRAQLAPVPTAPVAAPPPERPSLAVLPFQNISGNPELDEFADGVVEEITTGIARLPFLSVAARNSSFLYKGKAVDVRQAARELGVRYVLEGSLRKSGGRVRITAQLIDGATGNHLWADRFDGALDDLFALQDRAATRVSRALERRLRQDELLRTTRGPTVAAYLPMVLFEIIATVVLFVVLTRHGVAMLRIWAICGLAPALYNLYLLLRWRRFEPFGLTFLAWLAVGTAVELISGGASHLIARDDLGGHGLFGVFFGSACVASLAAERPLMFYNMQQVFAGDDPVRAEWFSDLWQHPHFRALCRSVTAVWGIVSLVSGLLHVALWQMLPPTWVVAAVNHWIGIGVLLGLLVWSRRYWLVVRDRIAQQERAC
jgi:TolB-like protein